MIKLEKEAVYGWPEAIRGMRNPMNSWDKTDSSLCPYTNVCAAGKDEMCEQVILGHNDLELMLKLALAGPSHSKYRRMITVYVDVTAPLYFWKEFDTYKVGTVANSCSTMHKIADKEFTLDDFSHEHLLSFYGDAVIEDATIPYVPVGDGSCQFSPLGVLDLMVSSLNRCRELYLETKDKLYWWQMIQLLPSSYNQKRTVMLNYEVLSHMYHERKNHKLDEWVEFCEWIETLPYSEIITIKKED